MIRRNGDLKTPFLSLFLIPLHLETPYKHKLSRACFIGWIV